MNNTGFLFFIASLALLSQPAMAKLNASQNPVLHAADQQATQPHTSPVRRIERAYKAKHRYFKPNNLGYRTIDGSSNNLSDPELGAADTPLVRLIPPAYSDGVAAMAGADRPGARYISNTIAAQTGSRINHKNASDFVWQWGQFLDHDIDLTDGVEPAEHANIPVPAGDPFFDPDNTGNQVITFNRSIYDPDTGLGNTPRQQLNEITAWIDASNVYGSDEERASALRTHDGTGRLKVSRGHLLPFNEPQLPNAGGNSPELFLAGDVRANEQVGLASMHTLFVREHNRLAKKIARRNRQLTGDEIYQRARKIVGAQMQIITYREFLPVLLGHNALSPYQGYDASIHAGIANVFSSAAYRLGHSALSPQLQRLNRRGKPVSDGPLALREAFFSPSLLQRKNDIDPFLRGLAKQRHQSIDIFVIDEVRNFLFGKPGQGGFDLASLNIQRGRDHGLPSYNDAREMIGLARKQSFSDISSDPLVQQRLQQAYSSVDSIDLWVGGLAEDKYADALVGELFFFILKEQFESLRDSDRYWYQRAFNKRAQRKLERTRLADIIRRNTGIGREIQDNVFLVTEKSRKKKPW